MSSKLVPLSNCLWTSCEYQVVNFSLQNFLAWPLTVRSKGWKKWVVFAGTDTISMFKEASSDKTLSVVWPLKTSQMSIAFWVGGNFNCWRVCTRYDGINQFKSFLFVWVVFWVLRKTKSLWKYKVSRKTCFCFSLVDHLHRQKLASQRNHESERDISLVC